MLRDPPFPISAVKLLGIPELDVTFDKPLREGPLSMPNWTGRQNSFLWETEAPPVVAGSVIRIRYTTTFPSVGPDVVNYAATPPDVISTPGGVPAAAFTDYPVT